MLGKIGGLNSTPTGDSVRLPQYPRVGGALWPNPNLVLPGNVQDSLTVAIVLSLPHIVYRRANAVSDSGSKYI